MATALGRAGDEIIITDANPGRVADAVELLRGYGHAVVGYPLDVTATEQIIELRDRLHREVGPLDGLINNAGVVFGGAFLDVPLDRHAATIAVNLTGLIAVTHAFLPGLLKRPAAHIVNIASAAAVIALPMATSYAASKWAVLGFSDSLREELRLLGHRHVGVTVVCPTFISTGLFHGARPARLTRWLSAEGVASAVIRAIEYEQEFVLLPWQVHALYRLCAGWPRRGYRAVCRWLGVSRSMMDWQGHAQPTRSDGIAPQVDADFMERRSS